MVELHDVNIFNEDGDDVLTQKELLDAQKLDQLGFEGLENIDSSINYEGH